MDPEDRATSLASHLIHALAIVGVHTWGRREHGITRVLSIARHVGRLLQPLTPAQAAVAASQLRAGSCLTRSIAISARLPGSEVVIGVRRGLQPEAFSAHAWVEHNGVPIRRSDPEGLEITRLA